MQIQHQIKDIYWSKKISKKLTRILKTLKSNKKKAKGPICTTTMLELRKLLDLPFDIEVNIDIEIFNKRESYAW